MNDIKYNSQDDAIVIGDRVCSIVLKDGRVFVCENCDEWFAEELDKNGLQTLIGFLNQINAKLTPPS